MYYRILVFFLIFITFTGYCSAADTNQKDNDKKSEDKPEDDTSILKESHHYISEGFDEGIKFIDLYFAEEKYYREPTKSHLQIINRLVFDQIEGTGFNGDVNISLDLPRTSERLKLLIESNSAEQREQTPERRIYKSPQEAAQESDIYTSILAPIGEGENWSMHSSLGMRFDVPLDPFFLFRLKGHADLNNWKFRATENLVVYDSVGTVSTTSLEVAYPITRKWTFRSNTSTTWKYLTDETSYTQDFIFIYTIDNDTLVGIQMGEYGFLTPSAQVEKYRLNTRFRRRFHYDWLYLDAIPEINYQRINQFVPEYRLTLQFEIFFGAKYLNR